MPYWNIPLGAKSYTNMRGVPKVSRSMSVHKFGTTWRRIFSRLSFSEKSHLIRIFENAREINLAQGALIEINGPGSKKKISTRIFEIPAFKIMKIMVEYLYTKVLANSLPDIDTRAREATLFSRAIYLLSRALGKLLRSVCPARNAVAEFSTRYYATALCVRRKTPGEF